MFLSIIFHFYILLHGDCLDIPCVKDTIDTDCSNKMYPFCAGEVGHKTCCSIGNHSVGGVCDTDARCDSPFVCSTSKRLCIVGVDGPCENDNDCETLINCEADPKEDGNKTCVMPLGRICEGNEDCPAVLRCERHEGEDGNKTCIALLGDTCRITAHCSRGLICLESTKKCVPPIVLGENCMVTGDCVTGLTCEGELDDRTCVADIDGICSTHAHCLKDLHCSNNTCIPRFVLGERCKMSDECVSNHTCEGEVDLETCVAGLDGTCLTNSHCSGGLVCKGDDVRKVCAVSGTFMVAIPTLLILIVLAMFQ